ncbi:MAG: hypothetical protein JSS31_18790, partial [Proteobacteria bacterium]|nr:hypothetical protein [Pseudomonadota bacterium]
GCGAFTPAVTPDLTKAIGYFKASNASSMFGSSVALSADGGTMAVGAEGERVFVADSNGNPTTATSSNSGAVYVFVRAADNR